MGTDLRIPTGMDITTNQADFVITGSVDPALKKT